ncbi:MAG: potassium/proton antiporter [Planctomycetia bacterium]|nr:potassium/proton antiporter [Planctomycetia bacterium]
MILLMLWTAIFLFCGIFASKISSFLKIPILIVFLAIGMLAGSEGIVGIEYDNFTYACNLGTIALAFILYSGGYDTSWSDVKSVLGRGTFLASFGVLATAVLLGGFAAWYLNVPLVWGLLLGSVISSTDAAAVFAVFRSKNFGLKGKLRPLLEYESGSNDPMAAFLTVFMISMVQNSGGSWFMILPMFALRMSVGIGMGILVARVMIWLYNHLNLEYEGLYYVIGIATVLLTFSLAELCRGNGFMAVYVCGLVMGNGRFVYKHGLARFNDGLAWLMQVSIFLVLGLLVFPSLLVQYWLEGMVISLVLMLVVRPIVVYGCLLGSRFNWKEKLLVTWGGFRGAAPIVLATFPAIAGVEDSVKMFHIVFFAVLSSIVIQGKTLLPLAQYLKLDKVDNERLRAPIEFEETGNSKARMYEFHVQSTTHIAGKTLAELALPDDTLVLLIRRNNRFIVPKGKTIIEPDDDLLVFYDPIAYPEVDSILTAKKSDGSDKSVRAALPDQEESRLGDRE